MRLRMQYQQPVVQPFRFVEQGPQHRIADAQGQPLPPGAAEIGAAGAADAAPALASELDEAPPPLPDDEASSRSRSGGDLSGTAAPFSAAQADPLLEIALAHQPRLLVNALGPPPGHMIERVKEEGRLIGALAGKAQHAERHVAAGVDIIIAQGAEAGGHGAHKH